MRRGTHAAEEKGKPSTDDLAEAPVATSESHDEASEDVTTVWSLSQQVLTKSLTASVEEWIAGVDFESTADVPIPERLVDQVIGQEAGSVVIKKAAEQRRHMMMIGDPGAGKSMLARSMTDLPKTPWRMFSFTRMKTTKTSREFVPSLLVEQNASSRSRRKPFANSGKNPSECCSSPLPPSALLLIAALQSGDLFTLLFGGFLSSLNSMFIRSRLGAIDNSRIPKVLVKHDTNELPPFVDATATLSGSLLGDVRHDPFQSGGMETPAHDRVEPGAIHRAHKGVLYIDEIASCA